MEKRQRYIHIYDIIFMAYVLWDRYGSLRDVSEAYALSIAHLPQVARAVKYILWFLTPVSVYFMVMFVFRRYVNFEKKEKQPLRFTWDVVLIFVVAAVYVVLALYDFFVIERLL